MVLKVHLRVKKIQDFSETINEKYAKTIMPYYTITACHVVAFEFDEDRV